MERETDNSTQQAASPRRDGTLPSASPRRDGTLPSASPRRDGTLPSAASSELSANQNGPEADGREPSLQGPGASDEASTPEQAAEARPASARETSGEYLWRVLKPAGAVAVLLLFILFLIICFTTKGDHPVNAALQTLSTVLQ